MGQTKNNKILHAANLRERDAAAVESPLMED